MVQYKYLVIGKGVQGTNEIRARRHNNHYNTFFSVDVLHITDAVQ